MATQTYYPGGTSSSGMTPPNGSSQRMALDNIFRRELRVSYPSDPMQVAQALLARYKDSPRAQQRQQFEQQFEDRFNELLKNRPTAARKDFST